MLVGTFTLTGLIEAIVLAFVVGVFVGACLVKKAQQPPAGDATREEQGDE